MEEKKKISYKHLSHREIWMYTLATAGFIVGWGLTIWGFCVEPIGEVHTSIQWILGQALLYSASTFGIGMYFRREITELKKDLQHSIDMRLEHIDKEESYENNKEPDNPF